MAQRPEIGQITGSAHRTLRNPAPGAETPITRPAAHLRVYVADVEESVTAALTHGGRVVTEPTTLAFGDVVARVRDGQGHLWWIHQHVEDVDPEEIGRRFGQDDQVAAMAYVGETLVEDMTRPG